MKYEIHETRTVTYTVEVPDSVTHEDLQAAKLNSTRFWARGCGEIVGDQAEIRYTVRPCRLTR